MTADENNRRRISSQQLLLKFEAVGARKLQIQNEARGHVWLFKFQELSSRLEYSHAKANGGNKTGQCLANTEIVIHHEHNRAVGVHDTAPRVAAGSVKEKMVPARSSDAAHIR